jgi:BirA family biotin operon repressor/biotin-[acetyl-CoA-carboxylase] ligase
MIFFYDELDSTNRVAKELVIGGTACSGAVVCAAMQSAGRGQYGRSFNSPRGGLYFSLVLEPDIPPETFPLITLATGLACRNILHSTFHLHPSIKWPNDLYLDGKKVAGIICENLSFAQTASSRPQVVIGVGVNVNNAREDFLPEVQPLITTLFEHLHVMVDLEDLLDRFTGAITAHVEALRDERSRLLAEWQQYDFLFQKPVVYTRETVNLYGVGQGISPLGLYRIRDDEDVEYEVIGGQLRARH